MNKLPETKKLFDVIDDFRFTYKFFNEQRNKINELYSDGYEKNKNKIKDKIKTTPSFDKMNSLDQDIYMENVTKEIYLLFFQKLPHEEKKLEQFVQLFFINTTKCLDVYNEIFYEQKLFIKDDISIPDLKLRLELYKTKFPKKTRVNKWLDDPLFSNKTIEKYYNHVTLLEIRKDSDFISFLPFKNQYSQLQQNLKSIENNTIYKNDRFYYKIVKNIRNKFSHTVVHQYNGNHFEENKYKFTLHLERNDIFKSFNIEKDILGLIQSELPISPIKVLFNNIEFENFILNQYYFNIYYWRKGIKLDDFIISEFEDKLQRYQGIISSKGQESMSTILESLDSITHPDRKNLLDIKNQLQNDTVLKCYWKKLCKVEKKIPIEFLIPDFQSPSLNSMCMRKDIIQNHAINIFTIIDQIFNLFNSFFIDLEKLVA